MAGSHDEDGAKEVYGGRTWIARWGRAAQERWQRQSGGATSYHSEMSNRFAARPGAWLPGLGLLGAAAWLGGWAWALLMLAAVVEIRWRGEDQAEEWLAVMPALLWTVLSAASGDRRLMFPYALQLAAGMACRSGLAAGVGLVALFAGIRWRQAATAHVLGVEVLAAAPPLALGVWVYGWSPGGAGGRLLAGLAAGVAGLIGLLL